MRRTKAKAPTSFVRELRRAIVICAGLSTVLAAAAIAGGSSGTNLGREMAPMAPAGKSQPGAVLFVPIEGNVCRRRVIDKDTWHIRDHGFVTCDEAVTWNSGAQSQRYFVAGRVDAIRAGFKASTK